MDFICIIPPNLQKIYSVSPGNPVVTHAEYSTVGSFNGQVDTIDFMLERHVDDAWL